MRFTKYSKWTGQSWDDISLEELMEALADHLLRSGFEDQFRNQYRRRQRGWDDEDDFDSPDPQDALEQLRQAIKQALRDSGLLDQEQYNQLFDEQGNARDHRLDELIDRLIQRLIQEGYLAVQGDQEAIDGLFGNGDGQRARQQPQTGKGQTDEFKKPNIKFEVTDKGIDFLGYKTLKNLMSSVGKSALGRHDTKYLSTGVEAYESSKPYEFGDSLNLDVTATLMNAIGRAGASGCLGVPLNLEYKDLMVRQSEYQSSCATVLMLDCSHSMILYGEDRFTPAKRVTLALSHLIRTQYPGDSLKLVLFHDSAEEVPLSKLASVQVGPYHTNTCEGLKLARRLLMAERKDMRQIIMITDGKPSALFVEGDLRNPKANTGEGRRLYKNSMGLDPMITEATLAEVAACRKSGIIVNTFMLTDDYYLVEFVKQMTEIAHGKAYFTTSLSLGEYVMMDFIKRKTSRVK
ncbi:MAG: VWA domain-containing protein [Acidobacteria bacterium]|nr:VWA domain-containing protein [Acidobacteriota bacterium]